MKFTLPQIAIGIAAIILAVFLTYTLTQRSSNSELNQLNRQLKESERNQKLMADSLKTRDEWIKNLIVKNGKLETQVEQRAGHEAKTITIIRYIHAIPHTEIKADSILKRRYGY